MTTRTLVKDTLIGVATASTLLGGAVLAECTQIDAATKLVSYYERYQEIRQQILSMEKWYEETVSNIQGFMPALKDELLAAKELYTADAKAHLDGKLAEYGIDVDRAGAVLDGDTDALIEYAGRNALGNNSECMALALGLGRDVATEDRISLDCPDIENRMVVPSNGTLEPNAAISLNGMLAASQGKWPVNNLIREDLAWVSEITTFDGGIEGVLQSAASAPGSSSDAVAKSVAKQMRLGDLVTGRGLSSVESTYRMTSSNEDILLHRQMAQSGRNAYAIEAIAKEAAVRPKIEAVRNQLLKIDIDNIDQMTEAQRYATRVAASSAKEELKAMLNESRLRHEQLEGLLMSIDQGDAINDIAEYN